MNASDINLLDLDVFTEGWPHDWFTFLRNNIPVYKHPEPDGPGFWVLTKYEDVVAVDRDSQTFSSSAARGGVISLADPPLEGLEELDDDADHGNVLLMMDPPEHTRYRSIISHAFRPRAIGQLENKIRECAVRILDAAIAKRDCDFVSDVAIELPAQTMVDLLGLPMADRHKIASWSDRTSFDPEYATDESRKEADQEMLAYARQLAAERRWNPRDDLVGALLEAEIDAQPLSEPDFCNFFMLLALAGEVTTRTALSNGMLAFLDHPDQYQVLVDEPAVIGTAVEEVLRWATPAPYFRRNVTRDTQVRGVDLKEGDKVSIWFISANRDEDAFEDPFRFDVLRHPNDHVAFGGGRHFCLGAHLARLELKVLFEELAKRVTRVEARGEVSWLRSTLERGIKHLPMRFADVRAKA